MNWNPFQRLEFGDRSLPVGTGLLACIIHVISSNRPRFVGAGYERNWLLRGEFLRSEAEKPAVLEAKKQIPHEACPERSRRVRNDSVR